jgi:signal transduction histidine kinase
MKSIRSHLTVLLLLGMGLLCSIGGFIAYQVARNVILHEFDYSLRTKVHDLSTLTEREHRGYEFEFSDKGMPEFERKEHPEYYQISDEDGGLLDRSPSLVDQTFPIPDFLLSADPRLYALTLPGGLPGRAAVVKVVPRWSGEHGEYRTEINQNDRSIIIILARDTVRLSEVLRRIAAGFLVGIIMLLFVMVLAIKWVVTTGLRPLDLLADRAVTIRPETLDVRFPLSALPNELRPIAEQLNQLLERIDSAFQRERYLTAAMAHELYTPIAELRSMSEVAIKWPDDPAATSSFATNAHAVALQMQALANALLALSRCESGLQKVESEPVDLVELVNGIFQSINGQLEDRKIERVWDAESAVGVETDRAMLTAVLSNCFKNAAEYTPEGGRISCRIVSSAAGHEVCIANTNASLVSEDLPHLFEPLWRKDKSRTSSTHSGLGLTVTNRFCYVLGIKFTAELGEADCFEVRLVIPAHVPE